jgi:hypothetical protein
MCRLHRLEDLVDRQMCASRDVLRGRGPAELLPQLADRAVHEQRRLLEVPRYADRPPAVAEVTLQLADDGHRGERRELDLPTRVESIDRLHEPEARDLEQVIHRLASAREPACEVLGEREEHPNELVARRRVRQLREELRRVRIVP